MKIEQIQSNGVPSADSLAKLAAIQPQLVLAFGSIGCMTDAALLPALRAALPQAELAGCSTAGEIGNEGVSDDQLVLTALHFNDPDLRLATTTLLSMDDTFAAGARLAQQLNDPRLHDVVVLAPGVAINGSALIAGLRSGLGPGVMVSGGLAGDAGAFTRTYTLSTQAIDSQQVVAIGFASPRTQLRHGTFHGWKPFGPARKVTRAEGNVLHELDGEPALNVYRKYLGEHAKDLPRSGLLFPFEMLGADREGKGLIRTILGIDNEAGSLILAGSIVPDGYLRLMHASIDSLVDGAEVAAEQVSRAGDEALGDRLALMVTCIGRKLVMGARVDEEVEAVAAVLGQGCHRTGFYSNGEISPMLDATDCSLHNQTMTITHLSERP
jgi:hypothetical protein